ncbi:MAG: NADH-quinone oxidoreductase subunit N [Alteromonadaceae bacterium]|nr:NADH-quinone oxidoreductase subunit N [Alteromonadaceae bacterium]
MITNIMIHAILPELIISFGLVLSMLLIAWQRSQRMIQFLTLFILICALVANIPLFDMDVTQVTSLIKVDTYSAFTFMLIGLSGVVVTLLSGQYLRTKTEVHDEYYLLLQLVILGASILVVSDHFASLFLGFELLSIALVGLVGYIREDKYSVETGFKYLILSASASSFMLLGIAFIYSQTGDLSFVYHTGIVSGELLSADLPTGNVPQQSVVLLVGSLLFFIGIAFKLSLVPFHFWTPDVYQGSSTPVTMILATISKVAMFTVLMKYWFSWLSYSEAGLLDHDNFIKLLSVVAMLSMVFGNSLALMQTNIKRLLGYSSVAHMGYLLIVLMVTSSQSINFAWQSALFYLAAYVLASLSIFTVLIVYSSQRSSGSDKLTSSSTDDDICIADLNGLFWRNKTLACLVILSVLSLAGIPLTMGFIGKFYLLTVATQSELWWLIGALIIGSGIGLFYYLRIIFALFTTEAAESSVNEKNKKLELRLTSHLFIIVLAVVGLFFGIFPDMITRFIGTL